MQTHGYFVNKETGKEILVLVRQGKRVSKNCFVTQIKLRKTGTRGCRISEECYLNQNKELIENILEGQTVNC